MEQKVEDIRSQIHVVLVELEGYIDDLARLTNSVFPEFAMQYPKLCLHNVMVSARHYNLYL